MDWIEGEHLRVLGMLQYRVSEEARTERIGMLTVQLHCKVCGNVNASFQKEVNAEILSLQCSECGQEESLKLVDAVASYPPLRGEPRQV